MSKIDPEKLLRIRDEGDLSTDDASGKKSPETLEPPHAERASARRTHASIVSKDKILDDQKKSLTEEELKALRDLRLVKLLASSQREGQGPKERIDEETLRRFVNEELSIRDTRRVEEILRSDPEQFDAYLAARLEKIGESGPQPSADLERVVRAQFLAGVQEHTESAKSSFGNRAEAIFEWLGLGATGRQVAFAAAAAVLLVMAVSLFINPWKAAEEQRLAEVETKVHESPLVVIHSGVLERLYLVQDSVSELSMLPSEDVAGAYEIEIREYLRERPLFPSEDVAVADEKVESVSERPMLPSEDVAGTYEIEIQELVSERPMLPSELVATGIGVIGWREVILSQDVASAIRNFHDLPNEDTKVALISILNSGPTHLNWRIMARELVAENIDLIQAEPDLMEIVDRYGSEFLKPEVPVLFQSTTEQSEGTSEPILRAFLIDIPSTEIDPMHAPTVEKPTYRTLILALAPLLPVKSRHPAP